MDVIRLSIIYFYIFAFIYLLLSIYSSYYVLNGRYLINEGKRERGIKVILFLIICLSVFFVNGDYWTYKNWYETDSDWTHIEESWRFIRTIIPYGYNWFRVFVWGMALLMFYFILKKTRVDKLTCLLLFVLLYTEKFCYARASLAYMCILLAFVILVSARHQRSTKLIEIIVSIGLVVVGLSLHRSMPILCVCLLLSLLLGSSSKHYKMLYVFLPIVIVLFNYVVFPFTTDYFSGNDDFEHLVEVNIINDKRGLSSLLELLLSYVPILLLFFVSFSKIKNNPSLEIDGVSVRIANAAFTVVYISVVFLFFNVGNGLTLFYRTLIMAYPFMLITIANALKNNLINKYVIIAALLFQWYHLYEFLFYIILHPEYLQNQILDRLFYVL